MSMTKCDFCTKSAPDGKCYWSMQGVRERDCEKAIEKMTKALNGVSEKKKRIFG